MKIAPLLLLTSVTLAAAPPSVYHLIWFDTEDFLEPSSDDAALRIANELTQRGVRATFKIVGEKARVLEQRNRRDVIEALALHDIGFHSNKHSVHPAPAEYLEKLGMLDGAAEFERREGPGAKDLQRIFGLTPSCYGQPGNSWGPQANPALRHMGIPVYMDDGIQVGLNEQPFWFGGVLYIFNLGRNTIRADLNDPSKLAGTLERYDALADGLKKQGGGVIQTYYHPTEFVTTEFWDAVNFKYGANPEQVNWKRPQLRTPESSEQAFRMMLQFVDHVRSLPGVRFITARDARQLMEPRDQLPPPSLARRLAETIDVNGGYSAAEQFLSLLGVSARYVDGPVSRGQTNYAGSSIPRPAMERARGEAIAFIESYGRLPDHVWIGSTRLSLADFAATLAGDTGGSEVPVRKGKLDIENHISRDAAAAYNWVIHPKGYAPEALLELARLQAWTLKPARLR